MNSSQTIHPYKPVIVPMCIEHLEHVVEIEDASFAEPWGLNAFEHELGFESAQSYVVLLDDSIFPDQVAGYICSWLCHSECSINKISTHPLHRRMGIGSFLLNHLIFKTAKLAIDVYHIEVESGNQSAMKFYEKHGFKRTGIRKSYYKNGVDAVIMQKTGKVHGGNNETGSM